MSSAFALLFALIVAISPVAEAAEDTLDAALAACRARALQQFDGFGVIDVQLDASSVRVERYDGTLGPQQVSTVLMGTGTFTRGDRTRAINFTCYLNSTGQVVSFQFKPRD